MAPQHPDTVTPDQRTVSRARKRALTDGSSPSATLWHRLFESALSEDPPASLPALAESAGTTLRALLCALATPDTAKQLESEARPVLRFLGILLAIRLLRTAHESGDPSLAKLALSVIPPAPETPHPSSPVLTWSDLLAEAPFSSRPQKQSE